VAVYLFVLWNIMSCFWSFDIERTAERILIYFQLASLVWILWDLYTLPAALKAGLQAYVLGAYVPIGSTVANFVAGSKSVPLSTVLRYSATGFNANDLGLTLALGIPAAWYLTVSGSDGRRARGLRLLNYAYIPAAILAILLTASRGALLATVPGFLFLLGSLARLKLFTRVLICAVLVGGLFALKPLIPQSSLQRIATTGTSITEEDLGGRADIWRKGIAVFSEHPILGVGSGAFPTAIGSGQVAHNAFLSVLVEVGMIGFFLFVTVLAIAVCQTMQQPRWDFRFWLTILLVWAIGASTLTWERELQTWLFLSLVVVSRGLSVRGDQSIPHSEVSAKWIGSPSLPVARGDGTDCRQGFPAPG
jgi:O-antigen ligase